MAGGTRFRHADILIQTARATVESDSFLHPVTFMGVKAGSTLARATLTILGSALALGIRSLLI